MKAFISVFDIVSGRNLLSENTIVFSSVGFKLPAVNPSSCSESAM